MAMSSNLRGLQFTNADWLSLAMIVAAVSFAIFMPLRAKSLEKGSFVSFLFEGVTLAVGAIVLVSVFYKPWFEAVMENKSVLIIVSFMTMSNGFRDIVASFNQSRSVAAERETKK